MDTATQPRNDKPACDPGKPARITLDARQLMQDRNEIDIRHGEEIYRLRLTRNGKLILTK
ncbi:hemin uptake protein HemP [Chitinimonas arctica]|uniref:Hemin uptake protein HemP n=1 Tax=Chitinimonas arctica TaxID=2594795 RepID=A0A516SKK9_9NEIS|nr:hemin uptake protein HemP [Chitinimonas arctica]QDQ28690.1 hemin uptake protein HemP [Chitinimonas arctica]